MEDQFGVPQFADVFLFQVLNSVFDEFVRDQNGERYREVRNAGVPVNGVDEFPEKLEDENGSETHEEDDVVTDHFEDHVAVNFDAEVQTAADGVQFGDFGELHGDCVSDDEKVQVKFPLFVSSEEAEGKVENGKVTDTGVEDGTVNVKVVVTEEEGEEKSDGKESVRDVLGRLDLEVSVHVKGEKEKGRRVDLFSDKEDEVVLDFLCKGDRGHIELSKNEKEIMPI
jgi:hypothetical protein